MRKTILIVEDDANLLYGLQAKFNIEGFKTITDVGIDKEIILDKVKNLQPYFVILDLILPKVDGLEVVRELKVNKETSNVPIFIFTNLSDEDSRERGLGLGADYYFIKSDFNMDDFVNKVMKIMENREKVY